MNILITGGAGFIGFSLGRRLVARGDDVTALDNLNAYYDVSLKYARLRQMHVSADNAAYGETVSSTLYTNYRFVKLDTTDKQSLEQLFHERHFTVVCNLAAQAGVRYSLINPAAYLESNIIGFYELLSVCRSSHVSHVVFANSSSVYGENSKVPFSEDDKADSPTSLYADTKKADELIAYTFSHLYGMPITGLRYFTVYGPWGRPDMSPILFSRAIMSGEPLNVFNNGNMIRDFTYIDDIVEGTTLCLDNPPHGNPPFTIFNIGSSHPVKLLSFIHCLEEALGRKALLRMMPMQQGDVLETYADTSKLQSQLGFHARTSLNDGIKKFVHWFLSYSKKSK